MSRIHSKRLGITLEEISTYLATEHRPLMRKRLRILQMLLRGATVRRAAKAANISVLALESWLRIVRAGGCEGLLTIGPKMLRIQLARDNALRDQIRAALDGEVSLRLRKRLIAMDRLLAGENPEYVALDMRVHGGTLGKWITEVRKTGLSEILGWKNVTHGEPAAASLADARNGTVQADTH
jgi:Helix-turn-helix domain